MSITIALYQCPISERAAILITSFTRFAIELRLISIVRLIATLCETGPRSCVHASRLSVSSYFQFQGRRSDFAISFGRPWQHFSSNKHVYNSAVYTGIKKPESFSHSGFSLKVARQLPLNTPKNLNRKTHLRSVIFWNSAEISLVFCQCKRSPVLFGFLVTWYVTFSGITRPRPAT